MKSFLLITAANLFSILAMRYIMVIHLFLSGVITNPFLTYNVWRGIYFAFGHAFVLVYLGKKRFQTKREESIAFWINAPLPILFHVLVYHQIIDWEFIPYAY
jgi:hypothetical protein